MSKPKSKQPDYLKPTRGPVFSARFVITLVLIVLGIAWMTYYYTAVRVDPTVLPRAGGGQPEVHGGPR